MDPGILISRLVPQTTMSETQKRRASLAQSGGLPDRKVCSTQAGVAGLQPAQPASPQQYRQPARRLLVRIIFIQRNPRRVQSILGAS
jgi:hypothetical protein